MHEQAVRSEAIEAITVVPLPRKVSRTISPLAVASIMASAVNATGFTVRWLLR